MDTPRILRLAFGGSWMKRLLVLLLLSPALAGADQTLNITSGSAFIPGICCSTYPSDVPTFNFAGNGFSATGTIQFIGGPSRNTLIDGFYADP
jgi:hypothetical protein